jgi:hypothetical protein
VLVVSTFDDRDVMPFSLTCYAACPAVLLAALESPAVETAKGAFRNQFKYKWTADSAGGSINTDAWDSNPQFRLQLPGGAAEGGAAEGGAAEGGAAEGGAAEGGAAEGADAAPQAPVRLYVKARVLGGGDAHVGLHLFSGGKRCHRKHDRCHAAPAPARAVHGCAARPAAPAPDRRRPARAAQGAEARGRGRRLHAHRRVARVRRAARRGVYARRVHF